MRMEITLDGSEVRDALVEYLGRRLPDEVLRALDLKNGPLFRDPHERFPEEFSDLEAVFRATK